jgi:hypothetical protein
VETSETETEAVNGPETVVDPPKAARFPQVSAGEQDAKNEAAAPETVRIAQASLSGQLLPSVSPAWQRAVALVTGWFLLSGFFRWALYWVGYRKQARIWLADGALECEEEVRLLGRTLRKRHHKIIAPLQLEHETDVPQPMLSAAMIALGLGSFIGVGYLAEGMRATSGSVIAFGFLLIAFALAIDIGLEKLAFKRKPNHVLSLRWLRGGLRIAHHEPGHAELLITQTSIKQNKKRATESV